jgi:hypothetical protein
MPEVFDGSCRLKCNSGNAHRTSFVSSPLAYTAREDRTHRDVAARLALGREGCRWNRGTHRYVFGRSGNLKSDECTTRRSISTCTNRPRGGEPTSGDRTRVGWGRQSPNPSGRTVAEIRLVMSFSRQRRCTALLLTLGTTFPLTATKGTCGGAPVTMSSIASSLCARLSRTSALCRRIVHGGRRWQVLMVGVVQGPLPTCGLPFSMHPSFRYFAHGVTRIS